MDNEKNKTQNVIQFPKKPKPQKEVKIDNTDMELRESLMFADHLTEGLVINLVHNLEDNDINIHSLSCIRDIGFIIELVKSLIHRDMGIFHPMQDLVDVFVTTSRDGKGQVVTMLDTVLMEHMVSEILESGVEDEEE